MSVKTIVIPLAILLIMAGLIHSCGTPTRELTMEVPTPQTVVVGTNAVVKVIFLNLPKAGCIINMTWYGFGVGSEPQEVTLELPPPADDPIRLQLVWESSNASILGAQMESPTMSSLDGAELRPGAADISLEFYFETLSVGTTELTLTLTRAEGVL